MTKYNYYCDLDKEECICRDRIDNGWCKRMDLCCYRMMKKFVNTIKGAWRLFKEDPISFCITVFIFIIITWNGYDKKDIKNPGVIV